MKLLILHFLQKHFFTPECLEQYKKYPNEPQFLPSEVKVALKMATEQGLYTQVVMIHQKDSENKKEK